jgi:hypothetical protein
VSDLLKRLGIPESKQQTVSKIIQDKESDVLELPPNNEPLENDLDDESKPYIQRRLRGQEISLELVKLKGNRRGGKPHKRHNIPTEKSTTNWIKIGYSKNEAPNANF